MFLEEALHLLLVCISVEQLFEHGDISTYPSVVAHDGQPLVALELSSVSRDVVVLTLFVLLLALESRAYLCAPADDAHQHPAVLIFLHQAVIVGIDLLLNDPQQTVRVWNGLDNAGVPSIK